MTQNIIKAKIYDGLILNVNGSAQTMDTNYKALTLGTTAYGNNLYRNNNTLLTALKTGYYELKLNLNIASNKTWSIVINKSGTSLGTNYLTNANQITMDITTNLYLIKDETIEITAKVSSTTGDIYLRRTSFMFLGN
jgi:hypothetical protein